MTEGIENINKIKLATGCLYKMLEETRILVESFNNLKNINPKIQEYEIKIENEIITEEL